MSDRALPPRRIKGDAPGEGHLGGRTRDLVWLEELVGRIRQASGPPEAETRRHLDRLTKPQGSLGHIEDLAVRVASIVGDPPQPLDNALVVVMAGDHGVTAPGRGPSVSAYPREVTVQMCQNIAAGGAAISVLGRTLGASVKVVDVGVDWPQGPVGAGVIHGRVANGTAHLGEWPAMSVAEAIQAIRVGVTVIESQEKLPEIIVLGEMGIGNSTAASALTAAYLGLEAERVVGRGTGIGCEAKARKIKVVGAGLTRLDSKEGASPDPLRVLAELGGLEIAGLAGVVLAGARHGIPLVVDGFISTAAALAAARICPDAGSYLLASHRSTEPGHVLQLDALGLDPVLDLDLRLGEGTGGVLALPLIRAAAAILRDMATFESAGVSGESAE